VPDCTFILTDCERCSDPTTCTKCVLGADPPVFLDSDGNTCENCIDEECTSCDEEECNDCNEGWIVNPDDPLDCIPDCDFIDPDCEECSVVGVCDKCTDGTYWDSLLKECVDCDDSFDDCVLCDPNGCNECDTPDYILVGVECLPDCTRIDDQCDECASTSDCTQCLNGFYLTSGERCDPCHDSCETCVEDECLTCKNPDHELVTLDNGDVICDYVCDGIDNCETCDSPSNCVECEDGFMEWENSSGDTICIPICIDDEQWRDPNTHLCIDCDPSCDGCDPETGYCRECDDDYLAGVGEALEATKGYTPFGQVCIPGPCKEGCRVCSFEADFDDGEQVCSLCLDWYEYDAADNDCDEVICDIPAEFANEETLECEDCHENCLGCDGPEDTDCDKCALVDEDGNMAFDLTIYDLIDGVLEEIDHQCVPDCPDLFDEDEEEQLCVPSEPEGNVTVTPPVDPVEGPEINCNVKLQFDLSNVSNMCPEGNSLSYDIILHNNTVYDSSYLIPVIDATNAYVQAFYNGTDENFEMDFTESFDWEGNTDVHLQDAWT